MKISDVDECGPAADLVELTLRKFSDSPLNTFNVTTQAAPLLWGAPVHIERNTYTFAVGPTNYGSNLHASDRGRLLDLLCSARAVADSRKCALFEHWMCHGDSSVAVMHRFAVYRSAELEDAWVITQSNI